MSGPATASRPPAGGPTTEPAGQPALAGGIPLAVPPGAPPRRAAAVARAELAAAPAAPIAVAARAYGARPVAVHGQGLLRTLSVGLGAAIAFYLAWLLTSLDLRWWWITIPFAAASLLSATAYLLSIFTNWTRTATPLRPAAGGDLPLVATIIPTCGEPVPMILRTVLSVLAQDYPAARHVVVVSDDGHDPALAAALDGLGVVYHEPPPLHAPGRDGAAKSGNLNSALALVLARFPQTAFVETRDADDEAGAVDFLRQAAGQLLARDRLAYVQTVKETQVSPGDPFCNFDSSFYRGQMLGRNHLDAAFPCGSGLLWRREALEDIGGFPTWNLVEDLQSGVEALTRGWHGCYLPIVGAVGQHSPEDVANVVKQRGTWAIDNVRLLVWRRMKGMSLRQKVPFWEAGMFYVHSFATLVYIPTSAAALFGILPVAEPVWSYLLHLGPYLLLAEARLFILNRPVGDRRHRQRTPLRDMRRLRIMWVGMAPVYALACLKAAAGGPRRKPVYRVTRKSTETRWYWRETLPQAVLACVVPAALIVSAAIGTLPATLITICACYWGIVGCAAMAGFVTRGWFGLSPLQVLRGALRREYRHGDSNPGFRRERAAS